MHNLFHIHLALLENIREPNERLVGNRRFTVHFDPSRKASIVSVQPTQQIGSLIDTESNLDCNQKWQASHHCFARNVKMGSRFACLIHILWDLGLQSA